MGIETAFSMLTLVCDLKRIRQRVKTYIQARLAYVSAMFNVLLSLIHLLDPKPDPFKLRIAQYLL